MGDKFEIDSKIEEINEFYDGILPPEHFGFVINDVGCVFMNIDTLYNIANEEVQKNLLESGYFEIVGEEYAENDQ